MRDTASAFCLLLFVRCLAATRTTAVDTMPSATGTDWEKYRKTFADDEVPEKKITPLTDESVATGFG